MTLLALRNSVRTELQEPEEIRWLNSQLNRYINAGLDELSRLSNMRGIAEFSVAIGVFLVPVHSLVLVVNEVFWLTLTTPPVVTKLDRGIGYEQHLSAATGTPTGFSLENGVVRLFPRPSAAGRVAIRGILNQPPLLLDADAPVIPEISDILIAYATWQALKSDGDVLATQYRDEYFYRLERFKEYTLRSTTQEGRIRDRFFEKYALRARKEVAE